MSKRIAVFGGSFNPPGVHHRLMAEILAETFDRVVVVPCGPRPDKETTNDIEPVHRAAMVDMTFRGIPNVRVDLFDLEYANFTPTWSLDVRYSAEGDVWHVIGTDLIQGGQDGSSIIQRQWEHGEELWNNGRFVVFVRGDTSFNEADLPPHHEVVQFNHPGASTRIRERIFRHESVDGFVTPAVAAYIERHHLYRGRIPRYPTTLTLDARRLLVVADERRPEVVAFAKKLPMRMLDVEDPNLILVLGGDGTMLHAIREHWRLRAPFFGVNFGHRGFLMNDVWNGDGRMERVLQMLSDALVTYPAPLLYVEAITGRDPFAETLAFNDAWVQAAPGTTGWIEVRVDGVVRIQKLVGDGALVATPQGSTSYARAMGATPVLVGTPGLILAGSNALEPPGWKSALLSKDAVIEFHNADPTPSPKKRPLLGFVDGVPLGEVELMKMRVSRIAQAELAFAAQHDLAAKLTAIQFPA